MSVISVNNLRNIFIKSYLAVLPEKLIRQNVKYNSDLDTMKIVDTTYDLSDKNVYLVGAGKAVQSMALESQIILQNKILHGIISIPEGSLKKEKQSGNVNYFEGAKNNLPDENAMATTMKIEQLVTSLEKDDILLVVLSGGGSALLPLPDETITLKEKCELIKLLANKGADIKELNTVRKKISAMKGGKLAIKAHPASTIGLILSDIVGDPLDLIASGPTVINEDDPLKAKEIVTKFNIFESLSDSLKRLLNKTEKDKEELTPNVKNYIIGSNRITLNAACEEAKNLGLYPLLISSTVSGKVSDIARQYVKLAELLCNLCSKKISTYEVISEITNLNLGELNTNFINELIKADFASKCVNFCLILGGEPTIEVKGTGKGGRNQHLALEMAKLLDQKKETFVNYDVYFISAGTDGIDGPTNAAGAISYKNLVTDATKQNLNINEYLRNSDSYNFFRQFSDGEFHVITGHTHTNVMDVHILTLERLSKV